MNFIAWLFPQRIIEALGWTLLHSLWQGALAALGFAVVLYFLRRSSARTRYAMGLFVLALVLVVSVMTFWNQFAASAPVNAAAGGLQALSLSAIVGAGSATIPSGASTLGQRIAVFFSVYFNRHLPLIVTLWLLGVLFMSLRFAGSMLYVQRLRYSQTRPLPAPWPEKLETLALKAGLRRPLEALESLRLRTPMAIGHFKPLLLLPVGLVTGLSSGEVEALLAHELAHIQRRDYLVNVLQNLLDILYFFHPGMRWVSGCVRQEREHCCDDFAVALGGDPRDFARALASLPVRATGQAEPAVAAIGRPQRLLRRVVRLLGRPRQIPEFREGFVSALLLVFGLLTMLKLVAAGSPPMERTAAIGQEQQVQKMAEADRFLCFAFTIEKDGMLKLSGTIPSGWHEQPGTWILSEDDGGLAWLKFLDVSASAGKAIPFSEEVSLKRGAYRWYLPDGCSALVRLKNAGAWSELKLQTGMGEIRIERRLGADGNLLPLRAELLSRLAEMLAEEKVQKVEMESQERLEKEKHKQLEALVMEEQKMKEEEKQKLEHELQALVDAEREMKEEQQRLESLELRETQQQERQKQVKAELERLKAEQLQLQARQEAEAMAARLEVERAKEELLLKEVERLKAEEERMRLEEKNFQALIGELGAAGLIKPTGKYKVELSLKALVVNGEKQPPAVHERIKKYYESRFGKKLSNEQPLTIVN